MRPDLATLNDAVLAALPEVKACLLISRDGTPLAMSPPVAEEGALMAWRMLAGIDEIRRGLVVLGNESWVFARRGHYGALALVRPSPRNALVLDRVDRMLEEVETALNYWSSSVDVVYPDLGLPPPRPQGAEDQETDLTALWREFVGLVERTEEDASG